MSDTLPILIAGALALVWIIFIFYGASSLYRRTSPLFITYCGTWICYALWYFKYIKDNSIDRSAVVMGILIGAAVLGGIFGMFGGEDDNK